MKFRGWQERAIPQFVNAALKGDRDQLAYVTPGGGKTIFSLEVARRLIEHDEVRRVVVVVHTHNLREQWIEDAAEFGLVLTDEIGRDSATHGFVITYQQLIDHATRERVQKAARGRCQSLVVFDECHHMSDGKNWGSNCRSAFEKCHRRMLLSGTPVRGDNDQIPFVTYRDGVAIADFTYGYSDALEDGVVPPVYFPTFGGTATWKIGDQEFSSDQGSKTSTDQVRRLNTMIDSPDWIRTAFRAADSRLTELREFQPDAAGLIICRDQRHAKKIHSIASQYATDVHVAISDDDNAHDTINSFRTEGRWLLAVRMVSEGVSINRLRVGLYATNYRTELFFRQCVGRLARLMDGYVDQSAFLYLPDHPDLVRFAQDMSVDRTHVIGKQRDSLNRGQRGEGNGEFIGGDVQVESGSVLLPGSEFSKEELAHAATVRSSAGLGYLPLEVVASLNRANARVTSS